jgi:hypothetical protein
MFHYVVALLPPLPCEQRTEGNTQLLNFFDINTKVVDQLSRTMKPIRLHEK